MKESLRKPLLFLVIVVVGSVLVLFDIPLLMLLPLLLLVGVATLLAIGSITIAEIRGGIRTFGKSGILKRLNDIKFFEKKPAGAAPIPQPAPAKPVPKKEERTESSGKPGIRDHVSAFVSSVRSLGSVLRQRSSQGKKVEDINKLLDKTVKERVSAPPPGQVPGPAAPATSAIGGGVGAGLAKPAPPDDPFVSLSGDEFDEELLKGLGDDEDFSMTPGPEPAAPGASLSMPDLPSEGDTSLPPGELDIDAAAGDILKEAGESMDGGLDDLSGLGAGDGGLDAEFGDLENLSLDDVSIDADLEDQAEPAPAPAAGPAAAGGPAPAAAPAAGSGAMKTAWIPSDAPKNAGEGEDEISTQADMAAFASGSGTDEDLLSSIASDVKHTKKEADISLVRELRDFRAPASEIEKELGGMFERMNLAHEEQKKKTPAPKGKK